MYTLVVIDMQEGFETCSQPWLIKNILYYIKKAKRDGASIVLVKYGGSGVLVKDIDRVAREYNKCYTIYKSGDNGAREINRIIWQKGLPETIKICGINTSACVQETIMGLVRNQPSYLGKITVLESACNCHSYDDHLYGIRNMRQLGVHVQNSRMKNYRQFGIYC